jgi:hypothetical protein
VSVRRRALSFPWEAGTLSRILVWTLLSKCRYLLPMFVQAFGIMSCAGFYCTAKKNLEKRTPVQPEQNERG